MHSESVKGFGVPMKPLMKIFGVEMDDLLHVPPTTASPSRTTICCSIPPDSCHRRSLTDASPRFALRGNRWCRCSAGPGPAARPAGQLAKSHSLARRTDRFGKLTMTESDLEIIDEDPRDPLDFSADGWNRQLRAIRRSLQGRAAGARARLQRSESPPARRSQEVVRCGRRSHTNANRRRPRGDIWRRGQSLRDRDSSLCGRYQRHRGERRRPGRNRRLSVGGTQSVLRRDSARIPCAVERREGDTLVVRAF